MHILWLVTPATLDDEVDLEMLESHRRLRDSLRGALSNPDLQIYNALTLGRVRPQCEQGALKQRFNITAWPAEIRGHNDACDRCCVQAATSFMIEEIARVQQKECRDRLYVLRILQDQIVEDICAVARDIENGLSASGEFLAGRLRQSTNFDPEPFGSIGMAPVGCMTVVSREVLFAPWRVWEKRYLRLPGEIGDETAETLLSAWVVGAGGRLIAMSPAWSCCPTDRRVQEPACAGELRP